MDELARLVLEVFIEMGSESLDLHTLFEAGGNDPASRKRVLDVVMRDTGIWNHEAATFICSPARAEEPPVESSPGVSVRKPEECASQAEHPKGERDEK
jgi:hypothetical protein